MKVQSAVPNGEGIFFLLEAAHLQSLRNENRTTDVDMMLLEEKGIQNATNKFLLPSHKGVKRFVHSKNLPLKKRQWKEPMTTTLAIETTSLSPSCNQQKTPTTIDSTCSRNKKTRKTKKQKLNSNNNNHKIVNERKDEKWNTKFKDLVAFQQQHGHCNVASRNATYKSLGIWLQNQRQEYKMHIQFNKGPITKERIELLESVGVQWEVRNNTWGIRFEELKQYIQDHGHCNVSRSTGDHERLGTWLHTQRKAYKLALRTDFKAGMTKQRMKLLESVGVEWGSCR